MWGGEAPGPPSCSRSLPEAPAAPARSSPRAPAASPRPRPHPAGLWQVSGGAGGVSRRFCSRSWGGTPGWVPPAVAPRPLEHPRVPVAVGMRGRCGARVGLTRSPLRVSVRGDVGKSPGCGGDREGWGEGGRPGAPRCGVPCCDGGAGSGGGGVGRGAAVSPPCPGGVPGAVRRVCHLKVRGQRTGPHCALCAALFTH